MKTILCDGGSITWGWDLEGGTRFAKRYGCRFLDAAKLVRPSAADGPHLDAPRTACARRSPT